MPQQPAHEFCNQIAVGLVDDERLQQDRVGTAAGMEQQIVTVSVSGGNCGRAGGLRHAVVEEAPHLKRCTNFMAAGQPQL